MATVAKAWRTCVSRLRWQSPHGLVATVSDPATMARSGAYLFGSGATLALIWLFLPVSGQNAERGSRNPIPAHCLDQRLSDSPKLG